MTRTGLISFAIGAGLGSGVAAASPAAATCDVTILEAPDDVRGAIETWVYAEPDCATSLEVRVVAADGGLYLAARDDRGRLHERVVPDAQSAGVLVASWMADDSVSWAPPSPIALPAMNHPSRAPGALDVERPRHRDARRSRRAPSWRWLGLSGLVMLSDNGEAVEGNYGLEGVRAELDLVRVGSWTLGVAAARTQSVHSHIVDISSPWIEFTDLRGVAAVSRTLEHAGWYLRLEGGAGMIRSTAQGSYGFPDMFRYVSAVGWFPVAEGTATVGRVIRRDWAIDAGPLVSWRGQRMITPYGEATIDRGFTSSLFFGIRRRL